MELVPEPYEPKLFELTMKIQKERMRRGALTSSTNQINVSKVVENDLLINQNFAKDQMRIHMISSENLNLNLQLDQKFIENNFGRQFALIKKQPNPIEQAFLFWYQSIFGDEWRLIADVINYHPFTKGGLREPEELRQFFFAYNEQRGHIYSNKLQHEASRNLELPLLINQRPPSLLCSVQQQCLLQSNIGEIQVKSKKQS